jgi:hypothetical protein
MDVPFDVTFQAVWPSDEVMAIVRERLDGLRTIYADVERCRVVIDRPRRRKGKGRKFRVAVDVKVADDWSAEGAKATSEHVRIETALIRAFQSVGALVGSISTGKRARPGAGGVREAARASLRRAA